MLFIFAIFNNATKMCMNKWQFLRVTICYGAVSVSPSVVGKYGYIFSFRSTYCPSVRQSII